jgi:hypothetical protein
MSSLIATPCIGIERNHQNSAPPCSLARWRHTAACDAVGTIRARCGFIAGDAPDTDLTGRRASIHHRCRGAVSGNRCFANTQLAAFAWVVTISIGCAALALCGIVDVCQGAGRGQHNVLNAAAWQVYGAAAKAITAIRRQFGAEVFAVRALGGRTILVVCIVGTGWCSGIFWIALQVPFTAIIALTTVAVKKAILLTSVYVVAWNSGAECFFVIVQWPRTLRIEPINLAIAIVVFAIRALWGSTIRKDERHAILY